MIEADLKSNDGITTTMYSFATPLKDAVKDWCQFDDEHVHGALKDVVLPLQLDIRKLPIVIYKHFSEYVTMDDCINATDIMYNLLYTDERLYTRKADDNLIILTSPREILQWFGTDCMRSVNEDFWTRIAPTGDVVISDVRFENEATFIRENGGTLIHVERDDVKAVAEHESEKGVAFSDRDYAIPNNGSLGDLANEVHKFLDLRYI